MSKQYCRLPPGPYAVFEAVSVASSITVDDYILTRHWSESGSCPACGDCPAACIDDNSPAEMQLEAPFDIVGGSCGSACANASGTFIGTKFAAATPEQFGCNWLAFVSPGPCSANGGGGTVSVFIPPWCQRIVRPCRYIGLGDYVAHGLVS